MAKGKVKRWLDFRGYGFIDTEEYDKDIFYTPQTSKARTPSQRVKKWSLMWKVHTRTRGP